MRWVKNSNGKEDAILTFSLAGFIVVLLKILLGGVSITIAGNVFQFSTIDASTIGAILTPTLGAYVARKFTDVKYVKEKKDKQDA